MKYFALLVALVCLAGCGMNSFDTQSQRLASSSSTSAASSSVSSSTTYDMLTWMTMNPSLSATHHMSGNANAVYTAVWPDKFFWTKTAQGFPWDIQLYDNNYIYLWVTELDWKNPRTFKVFRSPKLGNKNLPLAPRFANGGYPGSTIKISDSRYEIHSDCNTFTSHTLKYVINEVWGPYNETLGGDLPPNLQTMVISYRYNCDSNYWNCGDKEEYHLAKPYGLVKWQHEKLQPNGKYAPPDTVTYMNRLVPGQTRPVWACF